MLLLGSIGFLFFKDHILAAREDARQSEAVQLPPLEDGELEIIVEQPQKQEAKQLRALELDAAVLRGSTDGALSRLEDFGANAFCIRLKDESGKLHYSSAIPEAATAEAVVGNSVSDGAIGDLLASDCHSIARLCALHDSAFAYRYSTDAAVLQLQYPGVVWYDPDSTFWLDPEKEAARSYLTRLALECSALGFDELLFDSFAYPSNGRQSNIDESGRTMTRTQALNLLAEELFETLRESETLLSVELDAQTVLSGGNEAKGQDVQALALFFDRIYVETTAEELAKLEEVFAPLDVEFVPILGEERADGAFMLKE